MKNKCYDCIHAPICKYYKLMHNYDEELNTINESYKESANKMFDYQITCKKYHLETIASKNSKSNNINNKSFINNGGNINENKD